jgi:hypothetical protein
MTAVTEVAESYKYYKVADGVQIFELQRKFQESWEKIIQTGDS